MAEEIERGKAKGTKNPATVAAETVTREVKELLESVGITNFQPGQFDSVFALIVQHKNQALEVSDRPSKRAYNIEIIEYVFKFVVLIAAVAVGIYAINVGINSTTDAAEQTKRVEKLIGEMPAILGGLGGGLVLGKQWTKKKPK